MNARNNNHVNDYDPVRRTIDWDPHSSGTWFVADSQNDPDGPGVVKSHSPAISLIHELGHAYHYELDPHKAATDFTTDTDDVFDNVEEKNTILFVENPVAGALGEPLRFTHHRVSHEWVNDPTSRAKENKLPRIPHQGNTINFDGTLASLGIAF